MCRHNLSHPAELDVDLHNVKRCLIDRREATLQSRLTVVVLQPILLRFIRMPIDYSKNQRSIGAKELEDLARIERTNKAKMDAALAEWKKANPEAYAEYRAMGRVSSVTAPSKVRSTRRKKRNQHATKSSGSPPQKTFTTATIADVDMLVQNHVIAYTDGACRGNPGPGGWGVYLKRGSAQKEIYGGDPQTTNNRMELMGAIAALEALNRPVVIEIHTDSLYVKRGIEQWLKKWKRNGWKTTNGDPVKNRDLWERLDAGCATHDVKWKWVKGHSGVVGNERADSLAKMGIPV
jgi:ribonuclease HI